MVAGTVYNNAKSQLAQGNIDLVNDTMKIMLVTSSYTPNIDTHDFIDDVDTNEISGTGYTAGGYTLANGSVSVDTTNDRATVDYDNVTDSSVTITFRYAVLYKDTGTASTSPVVAYYDFTSDQTVTAGNLTLNISSNGLIGLT